MITMGLNRSGASCGALHAEGPITVLDGRDTTPVMDEGGFREFYQCTAQSLQAYLISATGNPSVAEDLLQEAYYRLIRSDFQTDDETYRKNYLFRIATNLVRDRFRQRRFETAEGPEPVDPGHHGDQIQHRSDLSRVLRELKPRERELLWLAYVEGMTHKEIAATLGLKTGSIRPLLFRARKRMAGVMKAKGMAP